MTSITFSQHLRLSLTQGREGEREGGGEPNVIKCFCNFVFSPSLSSIVHLISYQFICLSVIVSVFYRVFLSMGLSVNSSLEVVPLSPEASLVHSEAFVWMDDWMFCMDGQTDGVYGWTVHPSLSQY